MKINLEQEQVERDLLLKMVSDKMNGLLNGQQTLRVLEAGCGSATHVNFTRPVDAVGIDISQKQLDNNTFCRQKIKADLQTYPLPPGEFDVVLCWDVLEHLATPMKALHNMFQSTKKGGVVIVALPNVLSLKGLFTKATPYWFHKMMYRTLGYKKLPFPTYLRMSIRPNHLKTEAVENGLSVELEHRFEAFQERRVRAKFPVADVAFRAANLLVGAVTLGSVNGSHSQCILVFKK
jgi:SAM-dependent methyltransferase